MKKRRLPSSASAVWPGGFAIEAPRSILSIAAAGGTVLAGGEELYLLRPGATRWAKRPTPEGMGDAVAVAVDPRRRGRLAIAGLRSLAIIDGERLAVAHFHDADYEVDQLGWERPTGNGPSPLLIGTDAGTVLRLEPGASSSDALDLAEVLAMATDEKGWMAFASLDEENWTLTVTVQPPDSDDHVDHHIDAPANMGPVYLAVTGGAVAVAVEGEGVWMSRRATQEFCTRLEGLTGGPVAWEGPDASGALFGTVVEGNVFGLMRVDANGTTTRIGELEVPESDKHYTRIRQLVWDASRKTLWAAAGRAGVISSTAPGAPTPREGALS